MAYSKRKLWLFGGYSTREGYMNDLYSLNLPTMTWT